MTLDLTPLYEKQEYLEQFVRENIGIEESKFKSVGMVDKRVFAFKVEFGEFSNETAWFKYWKQSHKMDLTKVIEELADCMHFLLAIGIYRNYRQFVKRIDWERHMREEDSELYRKIMESPLDSSGKWVRAFGRLIAIGVKLGFEVEQIILAYYLKNQENIERQLRKY